VATSHHHPDDPAPIIKPPDVGHEPHNPVRDDRKLAPTEDLDREPDGVPHRVVGLTAFFSVMLAMLVGFMALFGGTVGRVLAAILCLLAIPVLVRTLNRKADRERDHVHPSR
jgi:Flp pilus assembly protein TadB